MSGPGHEDVLRKISNDFNKANINISYDEIKEKLLNFEKDAIDKLSDWNYLQIFNVIMNARQAIVYMAI